jgi:hypothetical protein
MMYLSQITRRMCPTTWTEARNPIERFCLNKYLNKKGLILSLFDLYEAEWHVLIKSIDSPA